MAADDRTRRRIRKKLEDLIGAEDAETLVTHSVVISRTTWMIGFMMSWSVVVLGAAQLLF